MEIRLMKSKRTKIYGKIYCSYKHGKPSFEKSSVLICENQIIFLSLQL